MRDINEIARDTKLRPVAKTIVWRVLATIITGAIVFLYTGELVKSSKITLTAAVVLTIAYYIHEEFWLWARNRKK